MRYIGIDLAWTYTNETGIAVLDDKGGLLFLDANIYSDDDIVDIVNSYYQHPTYIAIDAPLVINNETGSRSAEIELMKTPINGHRVRAFIASRRFLTRTYGAIRGETLAQQLIENISFQFGIIVGNDSIIETLPTGILAALTPECFPFKYKLKRGVTLDIARQELERLSHLFNVDLYPSEPYSRKTHKHLEDQMDAFLCAKGIYEIVKNNYQYRQFGETTDGFIIVPNSSRRTLHGTKTRLSDGNNRC